MEDAGPPQYIVKVILETVQQAHEFCDRMKEFFQWETMEFPWTALPTPGVSVVPFTHGQGYLEVAFADPRLATRFKLSFGVAR